MKLSEARVEANRKNATRSTGPRTPEGKLRSRANAVKHGLCSEVVGVENPEVATASPSSINFGAWLVNQVASLGSRVEHAQSMQEAARDRIALRAELAWEDDRRLKAAVLGGQISRQPDQIVETLRQTLQGCEWLISRWAMLAHAADKGQGWTAEQTSLAFDLLGTPGEFREGVEPGTEIDADGRLTAPVVDLAALARREVDELQKRIELVVKLDAADRQAAEAGLADDAELKRLRRYESALHRRLQWTLELLQEAIAPQRPTTPDPEPEPKAEAPEQAEADPEVASTPRPTFHPSRSAARSEKKLKRAEARREARLRKLDKVLA